MIGYSKFVQSLNLLLDLESANSMKSSIKLVSSQGSSLAERRIILDTKKTSSQGIIKPKILQKIDFHVLARASVFR